MKLPDKVKNYIAREALIPHPGTVLCGVSGGADSVALLCILNELSSELNITTAAVHINHCLRGDESDRDEAFVAELCKKLGVKLYSKRFDVLSISGGTGIEEAARKVRYSYFDECASDCGALYIATAHNANDNLETLLLRITRGTGLTGLAAIPPMRHSSGGYSIIRPLLSSSRSEIEVYLASKGIDYIVDSSNLSDDYARNRIRHHIIPELESINRSVVSSSVSTIELLRRDAAYLDEISAVSGHVKASWLVSQSYPIASRVVRFMYDSASMERGISLTFEHVAACLELAASSSASGSIDLPNNICARREYDDFYMTCSDNDGVFVEKALIIDGVTELPELGYSIKCSLTEKSAEIYKSLNKFDVDYLKINGILSVRTRIVGDSIRLSPKSGCKTLKKAMIEHKIPRFKRDLLPIICDESGVVAVCGLGSDIRIRCTHDTKKTLTIEINTLREDIDCD